MTSLLEDGSALGDTIRARHHKDCRINGGSDPCDCIPATVPPAYEVEVLPAEVSPLPSGYDERKAIPIASVIDYFEAALVEVAKVIAAGQRQHNTVGWDRAKSADEENTMIRHYMERGGFDTDGVRHSGKMLFRALAIVQKECERDGAPRSRGSYDSSKGETAPRGVR